MRNSLPDPPESAALFSGHEQEAIEAAIAGLIRLWAFTCQNNPYPAKVDDRAAVYKRGFLAAVERVYGEVIGG